MNPLFIPVRKPSPAARASADRVADRCKTTGTKVRLLPTRYGFIYIAMLAALLIGSINHDNNLGYLLTFLLGGISFASVFHTYRNVAGIRLVSIRCRPVFAGQQAVFAITVTPGPRPRPAVSFHFPDGEQTTANLHSNSRQTLKAVVNSVPRGMLKPGQLSVSTTYPLGLFRAGFALPVDASCLVYPRPLPSPLVADRGPGDEKNEGESGGPGVEDFSGLDVYRPGDQLHHISWKAYSRGQGLYTKKFEGRQGMTVYFNPDTLPGRDYELKLSRTCFMILSADAMRIAYGLKIGNKIIPPETGEKHKRQCLRELALAGHQRT